jgi:hypothetical protein
MDAQANPAIRAVNLVIERKRGISTPLCAVIASPEFIPG